MTITRDSATVLDPSVPGGDTVKEAITKNSTAIDDIITDANTDIGLRLLASNNLSDLADADTALTNLGGTATGTAVFKATDAAAGRTALGSTTVGDALFIAATVNAAQQAIDVEVGVDVQAYDADILKSDTTDTLAVGYTETPSAYTSGAINVSSGGLRTCDTTSGVTLGLISGNGRVTILLTGGGTVAYDAGYDIIVGEYDSTKSGSIAQVVNDGTNQWLIFSNAEA
jgi:hypothetical protein